MLTCFSDWVGNALLLGWERSCLCRFSFRKQCLFLESAFYFLLSFPFLSFHLFTYTTSVVLVCFSPCRCHDSLRSALDFAMASVSVVLGSIYTIVNLVLWLMDLPTRVCLIISPLELLLASGLVTVLHSRRWESRSLALTTRRKRPRYSHRYRSTVPDGRSAASPDKTNPGR